MFSRNGASEPPSNFTKIIPKPIVARKITLILWLDKERKVIPLDVSHNEDTDQCSVNNLEWINSFAVYRVLLQIGQLLSHPTDKLIVANVGKVEKPENFTGLVSMPEEEQLYAMYTNLNVEALRKEEFSSFEHGSIIRIRKV